MKEITSLNTTEKQLVDLQAAITKGDRPTMNKLLAQQTLTLHMVGMEFMQKADEAGRLNYKRAYLDIAL